MPLTYSSYTGDGSQTSFSITFDYLADTVVTGASPAGILVYLGDVKQTSGYTVNATTVDFDSAPGAGVTIQLVRSTPRGRTDRLVDFADATVLTEDQLDTSALQLLYIAQEAFEQSTSGGGATPTYLPYSNTLTAWDAETQKISRVGTPSSGTDAVNKTYADEGFLPYDASAGTYDAARSGADKQIDGVEDPQGNQQAATKKYVDDIAQFGVAGVPQSFRFTANGSTNSFTLAGLPFAEAEMLVVGLDGVLQTPITDYTVTGGATNSELVFDVVPSSDQEIAVLNFGKARFIDSVLLSDDSITTEMLQDQAVETLKIADGNVTELKLATDSVVTDKIKNDNVTTAKLAPDAVTPAELAENSVTSDAIADDSVDFARLKDTGFLSGTNANATPQFLQVISGSADLTAGTLGAADISDFNEAITSFSVSDFGPATTNVNMGNARLINLATPTDGNDAANKAYVDASTQSAMRGTLITDYTLGVDAASFDLEGWFDDSKYLYYEMHCYNFRVTNDNHHVGLRAKGPTGDYSTSVSAYASGGYSLRGEDEDSSSEYRDAVRAEGFNLVGGFMRATGRLTNSTTTNSASFTLKLPNNNSMVGSYKAVHAQGSFYASNVDRAALWNYTNFYKSTGTIAGLRFYSTNSGSTNGSIKQGARVLVYGFEGLS